MASFLSLHAREIPTLKTTQECDTALAKPFVVLFKHSRFCSVSSAAKAEVLTYLSSYPNAPVFMVLAQQPALSQHVAGATGVSHASPQIIVMRDGKVVATTSHFGITSEWLSERAGIAASR